MPRVFKLTHSQLESLLPVSAFGSLDTAISTSCRAMNQDKPSVYDEATLRSGLAKCLTILSLKTPLEVLQEIRQLALECLQDKEIQSMIGNPLEGPPPFGSNQKGHLETRTRDVTARQARGILANVFFANCLDSMEDEKDPWNRGGLDWRPLLANNYNAVGIERMRCHMLYFEASSTNDESRRIVFERIRFKPQEFLGGSRLATAACPRPVGSGVILHEDAMESPPRPSTAFVNFANQNFGYGKFIGSCTQEEILESCCPEFTVGMLWIGKMADDEVVNVRNVRRFSRYSGYLGSFRCQGPVKQIVIHDILTMDASFEGHFTKESIERDLNKVYAAFSAHAASSDREKVVSTGKWGCGAFGGFAAHKFVQQALAAALAGVNIDFSAFGSLESCDVVLDALQERKPTAASVAKALKVCQYRDSFVKDFVAAI